MSDISDVKYLQVGSASSHQHVEALKKQSPNTPLILVYINNIKANPLYSKYEGIYHRKVLEAITNGLINNVELDSIYIYKPKRHKTVHLSKIATMEFKKCKGNLWSILHETDPIRYICIREFSRNNDIMIHLNMRLDHLNGNIALIASVNLRESCMKYYDTRRIN